MTEAKGIYYQKPEYICQDRNNLNFNSDKSVFISQYKKNIEGYFKENGFYTKLATISDTGRLDSFIRSCYEIFGKDVKNDVSPYDIYRFSKFGNSIILEDAQNKLAGCIFEIGYDTPERPSYTIRLAIDPAINGKNFGFYLTEYSCLLAMERGSLVKRGLMETDNIASCTILVNKMGWICDGFEQNLSCGIDNGFTISLPLTPQGFTSNRIDNNKLLNYINSHKIDSDYLLIDADNIEKISALYETNAFRVVAVIRKGKISDNDLFFALPVEELNIH